MQLQRVWILLSITALWANIGCQAWQTHPWMPTMINSSGERQIVKQAKQDPFPSPSDVGIDSHR